MFKKAALALAMGTLPMSAHAQSFSINYSANSNALPSYTTASVIQSFSNSSPNGTAFSGGSLPLGTDSATGNVRTFQSNVSGQAIGPIPKVGTFLAIGNGAYTINFGSGGVQFLSFLMGGLDSYNTVTLNLRNAGSVVLSGLQIIGGGAIPPGTGSFGLTGRVSYDFQGQDALTSIVFSSSQAAFEIDEIAAAVPEPATWLMMLLGFGIAGYSLRRRRAKIAVAA